MSPEDDHGFMRLALEEASAALREGNKPFGAIIVRDGIVIGRGHTLRQSQHDPTAHAEIEAIRSTCRREGVDNLRGATLYATGEPCMMCLCAIMYADIQRVVAASTWGDRPEAFATKFDSILRPPKGAKLPFEYRTGILRDESSLLLSLYEQGKTGTGR